MKGVIFDFDGTLMDSMQQWSAKMLNVLNKYAIAYPENIIQIITPMGDRKAAEYFIGLGLPLTVAQILDALDDYAINEYTYKIVTKPYVIEYLALLRAQGIKMCILTASPQKMITPCLKRNGISTYFDFAWSCDDLKLSKAQAEIYTLTARQLGVDRQDIVFIDDNLLALTTAHAAGLQTIGIYDDTSAGDKAAIIKIVDRYVDSFEELLLR